MKYKINNPLSSSAEIFDTEVEAAAKLAVVKQEFLAAEAERFTVSKEVVDGTNTTWARANLDTDPEDATYFVFNTLTGAHEKITGLVAAKTRLENIKQEFLTFVMLDKVFAVEDTPILVEISGVLNV